MKITFSGKGGCGKSTITSLLARELAHSGKKVLIVDCDESNYGLEGQLGMTRPDNFINYFRSVESSEELPYFAMPWKTEQIPAESVSEKDGIRFMVTGKIENSNDGCACALASLLCVFTKNLCDAPEEFIILDMEAGVEHISRGIDSNADIMIMIVDPSYESFRTTEKLRSMASEIGKPLYFVLNKVRPSIVEKMREAVGERDKILCELAASEEIMDAGMEGFALEADFEPIRQMAQKLISMEQERRGRS